MREGGGEGALKCKLKRGKIDRVEFQIIIDLAMGQRSDKKRGVGNILIRLEL